MKLLNASVCCCVGAPPGGAAAGVSPVVGAVVTGGVVVVLIGVSVAVGVGMGVRGAGGTGGIVGKPSLQQTTAVEECWIGCMGVSRADKDVIISLNNLPTSIQCHKHRRFFGCRRKIMLEDALRENLN